MPTRFASVAALALIVLAHVETVHASTILLGGFNFNNLNFDGVPGTAAVLTPAAKLAPSYAAGTSVNLIGPPGELGDKALQLALGGSNGSTFTFSFNAKGYTNVGITFASMITGSFFKNDQLSYSTNGTSFNSFMTFTPASNSFQLVDSGPIVPLNDVQTAFIRLTIDGVANGTGVIQFDNFQITGTPIAQGAPTAVPLPPAAVAGVAILGVGILRRRRQP